ncbi:hypothetical protein SK128_003627 [Halocaridina rubra]|uniref:Uncharacterized protein n=1 Tax=Halocaridina rubra TaxID=373956 RepID=A0AAN9A6N7_HALRR
MSVCLMMIFVNIVSSRDVIPNQVIFKDTPKEHFPQLKNHFQAYRLDHYPSAQTEDEVTDPTFEKNNKLQRIQITRPSQLENNSLATHKKSVPLRSIKTKGQLQNIQDKSKLRFLRNVEQIKSSYSTNQSRIPLDSLQYADHGESLIDLVKHAKVTTIPDHQVLLDHQIYEDKISEEEELKDEENIHDRMTDVKHFHPSVLDTFVQYLSSDYPQKTSEEEAPEEVEGRGLLQKFLRKASTVTLTTNVTITKFFTCTSAEPKTLATCTINNTPTEDSQDGGRLLSTKYPKYRSSERLSELETSFNSRDELNDDQVMTPVGRFILALLPPRIHTTTQTETVTHIDYASTISIIYRGCIPEDAVEAPVCGAPQYPPCYYDYHGHNNYFTYYCNPNAYIYRGPHGYYCPPGGHCGPDPTPTELQLVGAAYGAAFLDEPLKPSPVIQTLRQENVLRQRNGTGSHSEATIPGNFVHPDRKESLLNSNALDPTPDTDSEVTLTPEATEVLWDNKTAEVIENTTTPTEKNTLPMNIENSTTNSIANSQSNETFPGGL